MKIKVCGLKYADNIIDVASLKVDYLGFICYGPSPRFIADLDAVTLLTLPGNVLKSGVFVNESAERIKELINIYHFDAIQLHGDESPEFCSLFKGKVTVIKAFGVDENVNFEPLNEFVASVDYFLFDTKTDKHGGSGKSFDWELLKKYKLNVPFFLSGGLNLENVQELNLINHPQLYGVDLNSGFEAEPGLKDIKKLIKAFELLR